MKDGTFVNTAKAKESWVGSNNDDGYCIKETLYLSSKDRFYLHSWDELECETTVVYVDNSFALGWTGESGMFLGTVFWMTDKIALKMLTF